MLGNVWSRLKEVYKEFDLFFKNYNIDNSVEIIDGRHFFRDNAGGKKKICEYVPQTALTGGYIKKNSFVIGGRQYDIIDLEAALSPTRVIKVQDYDKNDVYKIVEIGFDDDKSYGVEAFDYGRYWFSRNSKLKVQNKVLLVSKDPSLGGQRLLQSESGHYFPFSFQVIKQYDNSRKILLTLVFLPFNYIGAILAFVGRFSSRMIFEKIGNLFFYFSNVIYDRDFEIKYKTSIFKKIIVITSGVLAGTVSLVFFSFSSLIKFSFCLSESLLRSPMVFVNAFINDNDSFEWRRGAESLRAPVLNFTKDADYIIKKSILLFKKTHLYMSVSVKDDINNQLTRKFNIKELEDKIEELNKSRVKSNSIDELGAKKIVYGTNDQLNEQNNEIKKLKKQKNAYISREKQLEKLLQSKEPKTINKENIIPNDRLSGVLLEDLVKEKPHKLRE